MKSSAFIHGVYKPVASCTETHPEHGTRCVRNLAHTGRHMDEKSRPWECQCVRGKPCPRHGGPS